MNDESQPGSRLQFSIKTLLFLTAAAAVWVAWLRFASPGLPLGEVGPYALRSVWIIGIGCAGVAYLLRRFGRPLHMFFIVWIAFFGFLLMATVTRYYFVHR